MSPQPPTLRDSYRGDNYFDTGDLNGGGIVAYIIDAQRALKIAIRTITPTAADVQCGAVGPLVNGKPTADGKIDISDVVLILEKSVGLQNW